MPAMLRSIRTRSIALGPAPEHVGDGPLNGFVIINQQNMTGESGVVLAGASSRSAGGGTVTVGK